jgi:hypothetical protein
MRFPLWLAALCAGISLLLPSASFAAEQPSGAATETFSKIAPDELKKIVLDAGYRAELVKINERWRIRTGMGGWTVEIFLYCGEDGTCNSVEYSLGLSKSSDYTLTLANRWNREKRYAKAYIDTDGGITLEYDLSFTGGVTRETIAESARLFDRLIGQFNTMLSTAGK